MKLLGESEVKSGFPWMTVSLVLGATMAMVLKSAFFDLLVWERDALQTMQWWRVVSGHLVHTSWSHYLWDTAAFAMLGSYLEKRSRGLLLGVLGCSVLGTDLFLRNGSAFDVYCGLSGVDMGLLCAAALVVARDGWVKRDGVFLSVGSIALIGATTKILYEFFSEQSLFVQDLGAGFQVAIEAHLAGFLAGLCSVVVWLISNRKRVAL